MTLHSRPRDAPRSRDGGYALMSVLLAMVILGVMAAIVLGGTSAPPTATSVPTARTARQACLADVAAVQHATDSYLTSNLVEPPAGERWATASTHGGPYLDRWPSYPRYFVLVWSGDAITVKPRTGTASIGSDGTRHPPTGCFAI